MLYCQAIMVASLMEKLFRCIMESNVSAWGKKDVKRAYQQAEYRKDHSTIGHHVTL